MKIICSAISKSPLPITALVQAAMISLMLAGSAILSPSAQEATMFAIGWGISTAAALFFDIEMVMQARRNKQQSKN